MALQGEPGLGIRNAKLDASTVPHTLQFSVGTLRSPAMRHLARGLPLELYITATVERADGQIVAALQKMCSVKYEVWDEVYVIRHGRDASRSSAAASPQSVVESCLDLNREPMDGEVGAEAVTLTVRIDTVREPFSEAWRSEPVRFCEVGATESVRRADFTAY